jgi:hypothetical protein
MTDASTQDIVNILTTAEAAGVWLWPDGEFIHHRAADVITPELREAIIANKPAILEHLRVWNAKEAIRLQEIADGTVESLGVDGRDHEIRIAAYEAFASSVFELMGGTRGGCAKVIARAKQLAAGNAKKNAA